MRILRCKRTPNGIRLFFREKYKIDIRYKTRTEITDRTIATAEAFGLGVDEEREFPICDNVEVDVKPNDVIYITGDSGSGKSSILRELERIYKDQSINIAKLEIDENKPLVDTVGANVEEAIELLSRVGLNDAFLFIRKYPELSDGQKYRYRLAKLIESKKQIWICDEFCSTLDRDTAKIVAFNVQKVARKLGIGLFVATCNDDLDEDLSPSVRIDKRYGKEIQIAYAPNVTTTECSLIKEMTIQQGITADYKALAQFHYRTTSLPPCRKIFKLVRADELCGVIVYSYPPLCVFGRKLAFNRVIRQPELNQILSVISRVVIHPKYRTIGLGIKIVRETLSLAPTEYTETIAVMAKYNPFFEKAGMKRIMNKVPDKKFFDAMHKLEHLGFDVRFVASETYNMGVLKDAPESLLAEIRQIFVKSYHPRFAKHISHLIKGTSNTGVGIIFKTEFEKHVKIFDAQKLAHLIRVLALMCQVSVYLIWRKGGFELPPTKQENEAKNACPKCGSPMRKVGKQFYCIKTGCDGNA